MTVIEEVKDKNSVVSDTITTVVKLSDLVKLEKYGSLVYDLTKDEFDGLKASIAKNGIQIPIIINPSWFILDGHHRVKAARELLMEDVPVLFKSFHNELDELSFVISANLQRRQLNDYQKAELCIKLDDIESERARQRSLSNLRAGNNLQTVSNDTIEKSGKGGRGRTRDKIAILSGLSPATYARAKKIIECADEDTKRRLRSGKSRISKEYDRIIFIS
jgi:ParB-like nuclease domain